MVRLFIFLSLLLSGCMELIHAQNPFNRYVAFDPPARKRVYYGIGDEILIKLDDDKHFTPWVITAVTDSGFVVEGKHFVHPERVSAIKMYPKRRLVGLKRILIYGGAALPVLMLTNYALNPSQSQIFIPTVAGVSGGMIFTWLILKSFDWGGMRYKVNQNRPLKMLILDMKAP
ncbi:MAG: hypothetical protein MH137_05920 [Flavobacteriales bacterium]|nr:hypothetical protein [Flavobacteriales bacterium]